MRGRLYPVRLTAGGCAAILALALAGAHPARGAEAPDFETQIAPLLEAKCLFCHDADAAKGGFRLDTLASALARRDALVPGDPVESYLLDLVSGPEPEMPKDEPPLSEEEVALLRDWIAAGAPWPEDRVLVYDPRHDRDWWSLRPLPAADPALIAAFDDAPPLGARAYRPPRSQSAEADGGTDVQPAPHPVDAFLDAALAERGIAPQPRSEPAVLARRLAYDLTGLPPTPEEVDSFVAASALDPEGAWSALVDRLLDSPAFGEKFAQHWLDVARYADTHGYDKDKLREHAWPYRDYVIRSFREDKPLARFVEEQVAGDALYPGEPDGVLGLGFLAAGPWDYISHQEVGEGKLDGRIAKHLDRDEMVSAVFNAFQSVTVQCAQCHHHKFDPVRMEDYYRLHAVFAAVDRADRVYDGLPPEQERERKAVLAGIAELQAEREGLDADLRRLVEARASGIDRRLAELRETHGPGSQGAAYGYHSAITRDEDEEKWVQLDLGESREIAEIRIVPAYDDYNGIGAGFGFPRRFRIEVSDDPGFVEGRRILLDAGDADQPARGTRPLAVPGDGRPFRVLRFTATKLAERKDDYILALGEIELIAPDGESNLAPGTELSAKDSIEQAVRWRLANLVDGATHRELDEPAALAEYHELQEQRAAIEAEIRTPENDARLAEIAEALKALNEKLAAFPEGALVYAAATDFSSSGRFRPTGGAPRPVHLLHRGDLTAPGEAMHPGAPALWPGASEEFPRDAEGRIGSIEGEAGGRAALARTLVDPENPLLWRSFANRVWQWTFGEPIAGTPNDFGRGGLSPTHPELLDFLAASLRDDPEQSVKRLVRRLVTSEAYRRASDHCEEAALADAGNALYWRTHRRRLSAEEFRDSLLAVSGALDQASMGGMGKMGGPGFRDFVLERPQHSPTYRYDLHDPDDPAGHRRSVYRFVVRSQPQPMLTTLDCADPSMSVPARDESTTALQALTQWNHPFVEAMSRRFAQRLGAESADDPAALVERACRLALGRAPEEEEAAILQEHLESHGPESLARVVFNLNAFLYVD